MKRSAPSAAPWDEGTWRFLTGERPLVTLIGPSGPVAPPAARGRHRQRYLVLALWAGLIGSVYLWWRGTPAGSVDSVPVRSTVCRPA